jgi:hypothetical protein
LEFVDTQLSVQGYLNNVRVEAQLDVLLTWSARTALDLTVFGVIDQLSLIASGGISLDDFAFQWTDVAAPGCLPA